MSVLNVAKSTCKIGGKDYDLVMDMNALCALEKVSGEDALEAFDRMERKMTLSDQRNLLYAMMLRNYPETTLVDAADIMGSDPEGALAAVAAVAANSSPEPEKKSRKKKRTMKPKQKA